MTAGQVVLPRGSLRTLEDYDDLTEELKSRWMREYNADPAQAEADYTSLMRYRARTDLFYLLTEVLKRRDARHQWILDRCNEIQAEPNERLDLWAREHYKSTIITFALTIQDILRTHGEGSTNEQWCVAIFSYVRPIAKDFLIQIKREFEINDTLIQLFPDILYEKPHTQSPRWSDEAIEVKRTINRRESTVEAWGVYEGQPVSKHFDVRVYDDMVTLDTVKTEERIATTLNYWELSQALGSHINISRYIGTRYAFNDPYNVIIERRAVTPRLYPATDDGTFTGTPVFWSEDRFKDKVRQMGKFTSSAQLLQNPMADSAMGFVEEDLRYYPGDQDQRREVSRNHVRVILVDPASGKQRKTNDYTSMGVYSLGEDGNYYLLDGIRDKLKLSERADALFRLHREWSPIKFVGYEQYGLQADIEHMEYRMQDEGYHFDITELGGPTSKINRIMRLQPVYENHRMYYPEKLSVQLKDGTVIDLVQVIKREEYLLFPVPIHDDFLDMESRLLDPDFKKAVDFPNAGGRAGPKTIEYPDCYA